MKKRIGSPGVLQCLLCFPEKRNNLICKLAVVDELSLIVAIFKCHGIILQFTVQNLNSWPYKVSYVTSFAISAIFRRLFA